MGHILCGNENLSENKRAAIVKVNIINKKHLIITILTILMNKETRQDFNDDELRYALIELNNSYHIFDDKLLNIPKDYEKINELQKKKEVKELFDDKFYSIIFVLNENILKVLLHDAYKFMSKQKSSISIMSTSELNIIFNSSYFLPTLEAINLTLNNQWNFLSI